MKQTRALLRLKRSAGRTLSFLRLLLGTFRFMNLSQKDLQRALLVTRDLEIGLRNSGRPRISWSQNGEDLILEDFLGDQGFYVDVGAHHPIRYSVTKRLYEKGWSGVNIDVTPAITSSFTEFRPRDKNFFGLVSDSEGNLPFYRFEDEALNTVSKEHMNEWTSRGFRLRAREIIQVQTLQTILSSIYGDEIPPIDLLSVDVEGHDFNVLNSVDFEEVEIRNILVEEEKGADRVSVYLERNGFYKRCQFSLSSLYVRR